ncbi:HipA N-terminal domain-containing protein [Photorhabdus sp. CRCIA-P01]|uniref:HipA N-terminal domain-containing protein n=1 Tax=Photorhabdus sp. CRCIA-P01 TaxID=2019570 RepID=UPI000E59B6C6|nr:HipA N-terminal domain-containing protein [Photorhabdus sp. CRCIA-P01]
MKALTVALNGFEVGTLFRDGTGAMSFQYKDEWRRPQGSTPTSHIFKLPMALRGKNRQYNWAYIQPRHFSSTAQHVGFSHETTESLMMQMGEMSGAVIDQIARELPKDFPSNISEPIFEGLDKQAKKLRAG